MNRTLLALFLPHPALSLSGASFGPNVSVRPRREIRPLPLLTFPTDQGR